MHGPRHKGSPPTEPFEEIMAKAEAALVSGDLQQAERLYGNATVVKPASAGAWYGKGRAFEGQGSWDKALRCFSIAVKFDPKHADAFAGRARVWHALGKDDKAREDIAALAALASDHASLRELRALVK